MNRKLAHLGSKHTSSVLIEKIGGQTGLWHGLNHEPSLCLLLIRVIFHHQQHYSVQLQAQQSLLHNHNTTCTSFTLISWTSVGSLYVFNLCTIPSMQPLNLHQPHHKISIIINIKTTSDMNRWLHIEDITNILVPALGHSHDSGLDEKTWQFPDFK